MSTNPELILEKYITGEETWNYYIIAEGIVRYVYSGGVFRQPGYPTCLYSFGTSAPRGIDDYLAQMNPQCTELLRNIGCKEGIAWIQCIRDAEGNYYALEMAHRLSADASGDTLEKCLGFNIIDWMLDTALGIRHYADSLPESIRRPYIGAGCVYYLFADHAGQIKEMEGFNRLDPSRFQLEMVKNRGEDVQEYQLMVKITFFARQPEEMCQILRELNETISINDQSGKDLIVRFTDFNAVREGLSEFAKNQ